ncbi:S8 family serine peptidase [Sulfurovum sp.]|uniref:S8 family serine peptidase n=1 Tax=Sulfurovum sp. TaxID=1969726 RepID=UPI002610D9DC|nr:S8 family serine peptidase [Sulfurovum sp.]
MNKRNSYFILLYFILKFRKERQIMNSLWRRKTMRIGGVFVILLVALTGCGGSKSNHSNPNDTNYSNPGNPGSPDDNKSPGIPDGNDPLFADQWYLQNTGQSSGAQTGGTEGEDLHIADVWKEFRGSKAFAIAIVDDGIDMLHPDLKDNLDLNLSYRYSDDSHDPSPVSKYLAHGTCVAGIIAAKGWNNIGIRGIAPDARIVGLNVMSNLTEATLIQAVEKSGIAISSNSWGFSSNTLHNDLDSVVDALKYGCEYGREGKGTVYAFAAGNNRGKYHNGNANLSTLANNRYAMAVAAVNADGKYASYSSFGSSIWISGMGGEYGEEKPAIVTTDLVGFDRGWDTTDQHYAVKGNENGDYTNRMNGTSAACPTVTGVVALVMEANPALNWRDIRYVLAKSARKNDVDDANWTINGAGVPINYNYGFGVIDAKKAVDFAKTFSGLGEEKINEFEKKTNIKIPDAKNTAISSHILVDKKVSIEYIDVRVTISGSQGNVGDLEIKLISPAGTESILAWGDVETYGKYTDWKFGTARHLDEDSSGEWTLEIKDVDGNSDYILTDWKLKIYGH